MENQNQTSYDAWLKECDFLAKVRKENPKKIERQNPIIEDQKLLQDYGIEIISDLPLGFLRFSPADFIVEEITQDGRITTIDPENDPSLADQEGETVYADVVKIGIPTLEAIDRIAKKLNVGLGQIGYSGMKDAIAITSQKFSFRKISRDKIKELKLPNIYLKNIIVSKGALQPGNLIGNRFNIFIRTKGLYDPNLLLEKLNHIKEVGFYNFFGSQRFGGARGIGHKLGIILLRGDYELAVKAFLIAQGKNEIPLIQELRNKAKAIYGNWNDMIKIYEQMPYTFSGEIRVLKALTHEPSDYINALLAIKEQVKLWAYAYGSYLFNKKISQLVRNKINLPAKLPLFLSNERSDKDLYEDFLESDKTKNFRESARPFPFIQLRHYEVPTLLSPKINSFTCTEDGVAINFELHKGAYATTFLSHIFTLTMGLPLPSWVSQKEIDTLKILELGTIENIKKVFEEYWSNVLTNSGK
ncbi:MAG: tRNA pseudouridine(13) synthase TruD [Patescibacteria group bacterium]|jgi:TruD family tRNA pseudouridine synthase